MRIRYFKTLLFLILIARCIPASCQDDISDVRISYKAESQELREIFLELEKEYNIRFSYSSESIIQRRKDCHFVETSLDEVLDYLLEEVEYKRVGDNVLLRRSSDEAIEKNAMYKSSLHVRGTVVVEGGEQKIPFASVSIENAAIGTFTDNAGNFELEIPAAYTEDSLVVHYLGMEDKKYLIRDFTDEYKLIPLSTSDIAIDEIVIVNRKKKISILSSDNALTLRLKENIQNGILGDDLTRNLQKLAGVSASDDSSAAIKIRGSQSSETLILLDEMPIYNCSHFYGVFNSINTNFIDQIKLFKSYFPIEYGGKTGGVVHLASSQKLIKQSYLDVEMDLMTMNAMTGIRLSDKLNLTLAGRTTLRDISNTQFNTFSNAPDTEDSTVQSFTDEVKNNRSDPRFKFYDFNARLLWKIGSKQSIGINAFKSADDYENDFKRSIRDPNSGKEIDLEADESEVWDNFSSSLNYALDIGQRSRLNATIYSSEYASNSETTYDLKKPSSEQNDPVQFDIPLGLFQENRIRDLGFKSFIEAPFYNNVLKAGFEFVNHDIEYDLRDNQDAKIEGNDNVNEISFFANMSFELFKKLNLQTGVRSTYYEGTDDFYLSPRVLADYAIRNSFKLKSSYGIYRQFIREFPFEYRGAPKSLWVTSGENGIPVLLSHNYMIGFNKVHEHFNIDIEFYQKNFKGLTEYVVTQPSMGNQENMPGSRDYKLFLGDGFSRGVDIILTSGYKDYETYLSYTLSKSMERYKAIGRNEYFPSEDDRRHQFKWINSYRYKKFSAGIDYIFLSGRPYTDLRNLGPNGDITNSPPSERFKRVDPYHRVDLSLSYRFKILKYPTSFSFSVLNLLDNENERYIQNVAEDVGQNSEAVNIVVGNESALLDRTFNFSWKIQIGER